MSKPTDTEALAWIRKTIEGLADVDEAAGWLISHGIHYECCHQPRRFSEGLTGDCYFYGLPACRHGGDLTFIAAIAAWNEQSKTLELFREPRA